MRISNNKKVDSSGISSKCFAHIKKALLLATIAAVVVAVAVADINQSPYLWVFVQLIDYYTGFCRLVNTFSNILLIYLYISPNMQTTKGDIMANEQLQKHIGKNLQKMRKAAGYKSAKDFALHMGMKPGTYIDYEQGRRVFMLDKAWEFADEFECTLDELVGRKSKIDSLDDPSEQELVECYRSSTKDRQDRILDTARDAAAISKDATKRDILSSSQVSA